MSRMSSLKPRIQKIIIKGGKKERESREHKS